MRRSVLALALAVAGVLAGCAADSTPPAPPPVSVAPAAAAPPPAPRPPAPVSLPPPPVSVPPPPPPDQCGAYLLDGLVGKPRTEIPVPVDPSRRRVVCTTCPRTQDFRPDRLTIEYDAATGRVARLGCN